MEHFNLFPTLKRAVEIAYHGNFKVSVFADADYKNAKIDFDILKNQTDIFHDNGEIQIEIVKPNAYITKIKDAKIIKKPLSKVNYEFDENSIVLINNAVKKVDFSLKDVLIIKNIARTIASFDDCEKIELIHVAEAITYRTYANDKSLSNITRPLSNIRI